MLLGFGAFQLMFTLVFLLILGVIIVTLVRGLSQWHSNNQSPQLTVEARVIAKRLDVSHHHHHSSNHHHHHHSSTDYYVTFQVLSGDRMEFYVPGQEYGLLAEGDTGALTFQGTRYLRFDRYGVNDHA